MQLGDLTWECNSSAHICLPQYAIINAIFAVPYNQFRLPRVKDHISRAGSIDCRKNWTNTATTWSDGDLSEYRHLSLTNYTKNWISFRRQHRTWKGSYFARMPVRVWKWSKKILWFRGVVTHSYRHTSGLVYTDDSLGWPFSTLSTNPEPISKQGQ